MPQTLLRLRPHYALTVLDPNRAIVATERSSTLLTSKLAIAILQCLQQQPLSREALLQRFMATGGMGQAMRTLMELQQQGYVSTEAPPLPPAQAAFWAELGYDTQQLANALGENPIYLTVLGNTPTGYLQAEWEGQGFIFTQDMEVAALRLVVTNNYLHAGLAAINAQAMSTGQPWLLVKPTGTQPLVGPLFTPGASEGNHAPCWQCLQQRLLLHNAHHRLHRALGVEAQPALPELHHPLAARQATALAALELAHWLYHGHHQQLQGGLIALDCKTAQRSHHTLTRRPQCPACGQPGLLQQHPAPIRLTAGAATVHKQGGYRTTTHQATWAKYQHHISPITGIVPYVKKNTLLGKGHFHTYVSGRGTALQSQSMFWLKQHLRSTNGGKGKTDQQAKVGALCEAIERYCMMYPGSSHTVTTTFAQLQAQNKPAIHPNDCMLFSQQQYQNRERANHENLKFYSMVPRYLPHDEPVAWTPVYSLTRQQFTYLPTALCYAQYPAADERHLLAYPDSNGCAAGNTLEEAILQGFLELAERDAAAIWWYNQLQYPAVDLTTSNSPYLTEMVAYYQSQHRLLVVLDITTDLGLPTFVAVSHSTKNEGPQEVLFAFGTHIDAHIAIDRAVTEMNQVMINTVVQNGQYLTDDKQLSHWLQTATVAANPYLQPAPGPTKNLQTDYPPLCADTLYSSLQYCLQKAEALGLEVLGGVDEVEESVFLVEELAVFVPLAA